MEENLYKIYYGDEKNKYIRRYLKESDIIDGYLSEAKAFEIFYTDMILCNDYLKYNYENLDYIISSYNEDEDYYADEFQLFIINIEYDEEITKEATEKMGNTLYYDNNLDLYITGITDLGTNRDLVPTNLKVELEKKEY